MMKGMTAAITGASSGIGKATAQHLASQGLQVMLGARDKGKLETIVSEIRAAGGKADFCVTDVTRKADLDQLVHAAVEKFGKLDVIVNNAGISEISRMDDLDIEGWERMIDTNLKGVLYGMAAAIPLFKLQGSGHIVNIISTSGIKIVPMQGVYAATKNAVRTFAEAFRQESDGRIRITGISPGFVKTGLADGMKDPAAKAAILARMNDTAIPPEAVAEAVSYAISQPGTVEIGDIVIRPAAQN